MDLLREPSQTPYNKDGLVDNLGRVRPRVSLVSEFSFLCLHPKDRVVVLSLYFTKKFLLESFLIFNHKLYTRRS